MYPARSFLCFLLLLSTALAQTVRWESTDGGDPADLQLVFTDCNPSGDPTLPAIEGVTLSFRGKSSQTSIINFSMTRSTILSYRLQARQIGSVDIPAFTVNTDKGDLLVPAYSTGTVKPGPEADVKAVLAPGQSTLWAGEVFPLTYSFDVSRRSFSNFGGPIEWDSAPLLTEDWSKPEGNEINRNGEARLIVRAATRAYAKDPGTYHLKPVNQLINLSIGSVGFGLFQQPRIEQVALRTDRPELKVKPLPLPAPASYTGAVGQFNFKSTVVPTTSAVGEPVTWTLELSGSGNWPDITSLPSREVSKDFQVIQPQAKRTPVEAKLFDATLSEDVVLVPTKPGTYTLGTVDYTYFDPKTGAYQTIKTPATTITITPAAAPKFNVTPTSAEPDATPSAAAPTVPQAAVNPAGIPRDPIAGAGIVVAPFGSASRLLAFTLAPLAGVLLVWLGLAAIRTRQTDPQKSRRAARGRLHLTLKKLAMASGPERAALLIAWQHDTAQLWSLRHAAPPAQLLADSTWSQLWTETERALYSTKTDLPSDWLPRAEAALTAAKVPGTAWVRLFLPRNLLPFFVIAFALTLLPSLHAADPAESYRQGDFAAAEKDWRAAVIAAPTDWIARHNLSLALAQQDRWQEAAAQATAAFVQNPHADAARWNLALAYEKAGYTPTAVAPLLESAPLADLARFASPAIWERVIIISAIAIALAFVGLLLIAYRFAPHWLKWPALTVALLALITVGAALTGRHAYGIAAHPTAALVWRPGTLYSIPTEADTAQQTTTLAAGAMGTMDKTFLGWTRLTFPNGQTGWVRQSELVTLWK